MIQLNDNNARGASGSGHVSDIEEEDETEEVLVKREQSELSLHIDTQAKREKGELILSIKSRGEICGQISYPGNGASQGSY